ncbi:MAG: lamin tail domain-containing protein, partial [Deltaproteobacteria bacterium]|nr:lamin tail domain-containing protein [Deltaproteobacteria bacterium]
MRILALVVALVLVACGDDGASGTCDDRLLAGDLVITEVFADFAAAPGGSGTDEGNEWFEIHNTSSRPLDLTGLTLEHSRGDGGMAKEVTLDPVTIAPGAYLVLGNVLADLAPAWVDGGYADRLGDLYNTGTGRLALRCGSTQIDEAFYAEVSSGESRQLDGGESPEYTFNDDLVNWCEASHTATNEFSPGNYGTPGAANENCEIIVAGMCDDGTALRPVVSPAPGDLVITEIMPSPAAVDDALGEWFEVKVTRDVDLNGLGIDRMGDTANPSVVSAERCLRVTSGALILFARSTDAGTNGGLPTVTGTFTHTMIAGSTTTPGDLAISIGPTVIDTFSWTASRSGKSLQVDPDFANVTENDDQTRWCDGTQTYGEGDFGTPGAPNAQCAAVAPPGTCADGATSRPVVYPDVGDLVITEVMPSPAAVSDTTGEWFEVLATADVDLNGLGLDRASDTANPNVISSASCLRLATGQRALFARSSVSGVNGGLPAVTAGFTFSLITGSVTTPGDVQLVLGADILDAVTWTHSTGGAALALDPDFASVLDNDVEANWCDASAAYGAGDFGTPAAANAQCTG